jgi:KDO2-lipid IV(A) lauroyltransferase
MKNLFGDVLRIVGARQALPLRMAPGAKAILTEMRQGGLFLTAHYGNHEMLGQALARAGLPLVASYKPQKPKCFDDFLLRLRSVDGVPYARILGPRETLAAIEGGKLFALLLDQDYRRPSAVQGHFLGQSVRCNPLPAFLLRHLPETPVFAGHLDGQELKLTKVDNKNIYEGYHQWLEGLIQKDPHRWYGWLHRRFTL